MLVTKLGYSQSHLTSSPRQHPTFDPTATLALIDPASQRLGLDFNPRDTPLREDLTVPQLFEIYLEAINQRAATIDGIRVDCLPSEYESPHFKWCVWLKGHRQVRELSKKKALACLEVAQLTREDRLGAAEWHLTDNRGRLVAVLDGLREPWAAIKGRRDSFLGAVDDMLTRASTIPIRGLTKAGEISNYRAARLVTVLATAFAVKSHLTGGIPTFGMTQADIGERVGMVRQDVALLLKCFLASPENPGGWIRRSTRVDGELGWRWRGPGHAENLCYVYTIIPSRVPALVKAFFQRRGYYVAAVLTHALRGLVAAGSTAIGDSPLSFEMALREAVVLAPGSSLRTGIGCLRPVTEGSLG